MRYNRVCVIPDEVRLRLSLIAGRFQPFLEYLSSVVMFVIPCFCHKELVVIRDYEKNSFAINLGCKTLQWSKISA